MKDLTESKETAQADKYTQFRSGRCRGWHFKYPALNTVKVEYFIPVGPLPIPAFEAVAILMAGPGPDYRQLAADQCRHGRIIMLVEMTGLLERLDGNRTARIFLKAVWLTLARRIKGLVASPPFLEWWGAGAGHEALLQATKLKHDRYYLKPSEIRDIERQWN